MFLPIAYPNAKVLKKYSQSLLAMTNALP